MSESFVQRVIKTCETHSDRVAVRIVGDDTETFTFGEMLSQMRSIAYCLQLNDVKFGDRVALIGENHPCWEIAYLGTLYHGAVCVPLDPHGEIDTLTNFLINSEAKLVFLSPEVTEIYHEIEAKLGRKIPAVVWRGKNENDGFERFEDWSATEFSASFAETVPKAHGDDVALLMYTSGTTGTPKGVPLTHGNIVAELDGINRALLLTEKEKILSLLPLFHAYLQIVNLWVAMTYGCEVGFLKEMTPDELGKAMRTFKPTLLTTVPRLWYLFHKKIFDAVNAKPKPVQLIFKTMLALNGFSRDKFGVNLGDKLFGQVQESFGGNLRFAITAGSRFDESVAEDFYKLGFTIIQGYGLTETSGAATATYEKDNRVGSVGKAFYTAEVKLDNPNKDGIGEVLIRGDIVFKGYYQNPTATAEVFTDDGWFRSGDLGKFDSDGHLYIVGRAKDVIVLPNGKNIHPEDLEVHYLKTPLIEELAVVGLEDKSDGKAGAEKLALIVIPDFNYLKQAKIANSKEAVRFELDTLGRDLPEYQRIREYIIRAEPLPRTATRKIKRFALKQEIESGITEIGATETKTWQLTDDEQRLLDTNAGKTVVSVIKQNSKDVETVHPAMNLEIDLGLDSLGRAEVFAALEQAFGVEFDGDQAARALTVSDVIKLAEQNKTSDASSELVATNWAKIVRQNDEIPDEIKPVLKRKVIFPIISFTLAKFVFVFWKLFTRLEIEGMEHIKSLKTPFLVCPNHQSFLDPFILCTAYPYRIFKDIFHVGAIEFFKGAIMSQMAKLLNVVPIDPDTQLMRAMKASAIGLKNGKILNIYPEGERAFDGELSKFKKGAAILATELDLPIVPVAFDGVYKVWARNTLKIRPAKVKIKIGKPFYVKDILKETLSDEAKYEFVTDHLKQTIAQMLEEMRK